MTEFTDDQRVEMIENQVEHIIALCDTYVESGEEYDIDNVRALYEEYGEWIDTFTGVEDSDEEYTTAWAPNMMEVRHPRNWTTGRRQTAPMLYNMFIKQRRA